MHDPDDELEAELRRLAAAWDPVPAELRQAAVDAFAWRDIDAEIAELVYDSLLDAEAASLVRGPAEQRLVSFAAGGPTIHLEVARGGAGRAALGPTPPPPPPPAGPAVGCAGAGPPPAGHGHRRGGGRGRVRAGPVPAGRGEPAAAPTARCGRARGRHRLDCPLAGAASRHGTRRGPRCRQAPRR